MTLKHTRLQLTLHFKTPLGEQTVPHSQASGCQSSPRRGQLVNEAPSTNPRLDFNLLDLGENLVSRIIQHREGRSAGPRAI